MVKNKIAPPFRKCEFDILVNQGISREGDLLDLGVENGVVLKSGTWLSFKHPKEGELRLGQGRERARAFLAENRDITDELQRAVLAKSIAAAAAPAAKPGGPTPGAPAAAAPLPASASTPGAPSLKPVPKPADPAKPAGAMPAKQA